MVIGIKEDSGMHYAIDVFKTKSEADAAANRIDGVRRAHRGLFLGKGLNNG